MITFGTNPGMGDAGHRERCRTPRGRAIRARGGRWRRRSRYMGLRPGQPLLGHPIDVVFIGSCTNGRLSDLRAAARVMRGRRVAARVRALVVPGSREVKRAAEAEGLDRVFREAGAEWREPGCSMCIAMNGDQRRAGPVRGEHLQPQLRGTAGTGGAHLPRQPAHARQRRRSPVRSPTRVPSWTAVPRGDADGAVQDAQLTDGGAPRAEHRHRPDHSRAVPQGDRPGKGWGSWLFADWRYDGRGRPGGRVSSQRPEAAGRAHSGGRRRTSAAARPASTLPGRWWTYGFRAVISVSIADIFRNNAIKNGLVPGGGRRGGAPGAARPARRRGDRGPRGAGSHRARRSRPLQHRPLRPPLSARRNGRARIPPRTGLGNQRLRAGASPRGRAHETPDRGAGRRRDRPGGDRSGCSNAGRGGRAARGQDSSCRRASSEVAPSTRRARRSRRRRWPSAARRAPSCSGPWADHSGRPRRGSVRSRVCSRCVASWVSSPTCVRSPFTRWSSPARRCGPSCSAAWISWWCAS